MAAKYKIGDTVFTYTEGYVMKRTVMMIVEETTSRCTSVSYHLSRTSGSGGSGSIPVRESNVFSSVHALSNGIFNSIVIDETITIS